MFQSSRYAQMILRIGLAAVFLWFGIATLLQPQHWIDTWLPWFLQKGAASVGLSTQNTAILSGIFEVLVAASLVTGFFVRWFAIAAAVLLVAVMVSHHLTEAHIPDVGLIAALISLVLWPKRRYS